MRQPIDWTFTSTLPPAAASPALNVAPRTVRRTTARQRPGATSTSSNIRRGCMPVCRVSGARIAGIRTVTRFPWARKDSGFTLLFEALVMTLDTSMPVGAAARRRGWRANTTPRVIHHYVEEARGRADASDVTRLAIDETAARRGHDYITLFVDIDEARVVHVTEGKDAATVAAFAGDLIEHGGDSDQITEVCIDMSPAFIKGTTEHLPNAVVTFDKFHAVKIINDAVDQVRRAEQRGQMAPKGTRYIWLRNPSTLS